MINEYGIFTYFFFLSFRLQFQQLNGDPKVLDETNTPGYDETLKQYATTMAPVVNEEQIENNRNVNSPGEVILSKIDDNKNLNDTMKTTLKKWFNDIFTLLHI